MLLNILQLSDVNIIQILFRIYICKELNKLNKEEFSVLR